MRGALRSLPLLAHRVAQELHRPIKPKRMIEGHYPDAVLHIIKSRNGFFAAAIPMAGSHSLIDLSCNSYLVRKVILNRATL